MKLALLGYGAMGQRIHTLAEARGHSVVAIVDPHSPHATAAQLSIEAVKDAEMMVDFTHPDAVLSTLELLLPTGIPLMMGTTGWVEHLDTVREKVLTSGGTLLWSSNFSIGVNLYFKLVQRAAELMNRFEEYDVWGTELHHKNKADSPSGTAKSLEHILLEKLDRKTAVVEDRLNRRIEPHEIHFSSTRGGSVNFSHTIGFDSEADTLTLTHSARNRDGYVLGAIQVAEWLQGKKGFFSMEDFMNEQVTINI